jgi:hypothetical protein
MAQDMVPKWRKTAEPVRDFRVRVVFVAGAAGDNDLEPGP